MKLIEPLTEEQKSLMTKEEISNHGKRVAGQVYYSLGKPDKIKESVLEAIKKSSPTLIKNYSEAKQELKALDLCARTKSIRDIVYSFPELNLIESEFLYNELVECLMKTNCGEKLDTSKYCIQAGNLLAESILRQGGNLDFSEELFSESASVVKEAEVKAALGFFSTPEAWNAVNQ